MKKISLSVLLFILTAFPALCQDYTVGIRNEDGFASAYKSITTGNGYYAKNETRYGLVNSSGKFILPMIYKTVFSAGAPGVYEVKDTMDKAALFDAGSQKFITEAVYYEIDRFSEGLAIVKKPMQPYGFQWGAVDTKGTIVIPAEYEYLGSLKEGLLNFKKDGKMGFMDRNMKVVIPAMYYNYADFSNGLAVAKAEETGKVGYIDKKNNFVIPAKYEDANAFYNGYAVVASKKSYTSGGAGKGSVTTPGEMLLINKEGKELTASPYHNISFYYDGGLFVVTRDKKKGVIDSAGKLILPVEHKEATSDYNGNIIFRTQDDKYGMINNKGDVIMKPEYEYIASASYDKMYFKKDGKYAVMDKNRKIIIPADSALSITRGKKQVLFIYGNKVKVFDNNGKLVKTFTEGNIKPYTTGFAANEDSLRVSYDAAVEIINPATGTKKQVPSAEAGDFNEEGIFLAKNKSFKYDFYDYSGKKLNTEGYYAAVNFSEGICVLQDNSNSKPYLADKTFKKIKELSLNFQGPFSEGLAACTNPAMSQVVYINKNGDQVFSVTAKEGGRCINGRIAIKDAYGWFSYLDKTGKGIGKQSWNGLGDFSDGLAAVKGDGKWGFVDSTGNEVIPTQFDEVSSFTNGAAVVKINGKYKLINKKGEAIGNILYEGAGDPANGTFPLMKGDKVGLVDNKGNVIVGFNYKNIRPMREERTWAMQDGKWGLLDSKGNTITGFIYKDVGDFENGYAKVKVGDKIALINKMGKVVVPADYGSMGSVYKNSIIGIKSAGVVMYGLK